MRRSQTQRERRRGRQRGTVPRRRRDRGRGGTRRGRPRGTRRGRGRPTLTRRGRNRYRRRRRMSEESSDEDFVPASSSSDSSQSQSQSQSNDSQHSNNQAMEDDDTEEEQEVQERTRTPVTRRRRRNSFIVEEEPNFGFGDDDDEYIDDVEGRAHRDQLNALRVLGDDARNQRERLLEQNHTFRRNGEDHEQRGHYCGDLIECSHCGAILLEKEKTGFCCCKGKYIAQKLHPLPNDLLRIYETDFFSKYSRYVNSNFCLCGVGCTPTAPTGGRANDYGFVHFDVHGPGSFVTLHGKTYHRVMGDTRDCPLKWFLSDGAYDDGNFRFGVDTISAARERERVEGFINSLRPILERVNSAISRFSLIREHSQNLMNATFWMHSGSHNNQNLQNPANNANLIPAQMHHSRVAVNLMESVDQYRYYVAIPRIPTIESNNDQQNHQNIQQSNNQVENEESDEVNDRNMNDEETHDEDNNMNDEETHESDDDEDSNMSDEEPHESDDEDRNMNDEETHESDDDGSDEDGSEEEESDEDEDALRPIKLYNGNDLTEPLQYPLLFPHGETGWYYKKDPQTDEWLTYLSTTNQKMSLLWYLRQRILVEKAFHLCGQLMSEYVVDQFSRYEEMRLEWIRNNQRLFRITNRNEILTRINQNNNANNNQNNGNNNQNNTNNNQNNQNNNANNNQNDRRNRTRRGNRRRTGRERRRRNESAETFRNRRNNQVGRVYIPSSFVGGTRHSAKKAANGMYIVRKLGRTTLFVTMTCNPKWEEITRELKPHQTPYERPDVVSRVFKNKMSELMKLLKNGVAFGRRTAYILRVVEFQMRGLPHCHIALRLQGPPMQVSEIDEIISAEIPNEREDRDLYELVTGNMIHRCTARCDSRRCFYPKERNESTHFHDSGYCIYRRRNVNPWNDEIDDSNVVPYNKFLLKYFRCHINVEFSEKVRIIKYLYKYIYKGSDHVRAQINQVEDEEDRERLRTDEVFRREYFRTFGAAEAIWRIFGFKTNYTYPAVDCLPIHLKGEDSIVYNETNTENGGNLEEISLKTASKLSRYFYRPNSPIFDNMTYCEYYEKYLTSSNAPTRYANTFATELRRGRNLFRERVREYNPRASDFYVFKRTKGRKLCRLGVVNRAGERLCLRKLLERFPARSFDEYLQWNGQQFNTYADVCIARGIIERNNWQSETLREAVANGSTPGELRALFVLLCSEGGPANNLWQSFGGYMCFDYEQRRGNHTYDRTNVNNASVDSRNECLADINLLFNERGYTLEDFGMQGPARVVDIARERMRLEQNRQRNDQAWRLKYSMLNNEQKRVFDRVYDTVANPTRRSNTFFLNAKAGRGKSFVMKAITERCRSERKIVLCCCFTGIAAIDHEGGVTLHSMFGLPITENRTVSCGASREREELLRASEMIIIDEVPMVDKKFLEAIDRFLKRIMDSTEVMGGKVVLMGGDFRQLPPVVKGVDADTVVDYSIKMSPMFSSFHHLQLTIPVRDANDVEYSRWVSDMGDGALPDERNPENNSTTKQIKLPPNLRIFTHFEDGWDWLNERLEVSIDRITANDDLDKLQEVSSRMFLSSRNAVVDDLNDRILSKREEPYRYIESQNWIEDESFDINDFDNLLAHEMTNDVEGYLQSLEESGVPPHGLKLKVGSVCMVMRNLSPQNRIMNGTRVIIKEIHRRFIRVVKVDDGIEYLIPKIKFTMKASNRGLKSIRLQFPLRVCHTITVNKSQGKTIKRLVIDLRDAVFSHGALYVAFGRVAGFENVAVLVNEDQIEDENVVITSNVVNQRLLSNNNNDQQRNIIQQSNRPDARDHHLHLDEEDNNNDMRELVGTNQRAEYRRSELKWVDQNFDNDLSIDENFDRIEREEREREEDYQWAAQWLEEEQLEEEGGENEWSDDELESRINDSRR